MVKDKVVRNGGVGGKFDIRALSPHDNTTIPLTSPEPESVSTQSVTLRADTTTTSATLIGDNVSESERTISACSTLDGEDDLLSATESLL